MKKTFFTLLGIVAFSLFSSFTFAQRVLELGESKIIIQSPFKIKSKNSTDSVIVYKEGGVKYSYSRGYRRHSDAFYIGFGFACPSGNDEKLPIYYGSSYNLKIGHRYFYRPTKAYAIGTFLQYSFYSYKLNHQGKDLFDLSIATDKGTQYFRTDNIGTGIVNRFYLFPHSYKRQVYLEAGIWGDFSYSKRLKIKDFSSGHKEKYKYRDGSKFNPFQAGLHAAIGYGGIQVNCEYRLTDQFRYNKVDEPDRLTIGIQIAF